MKTSRQRLLEYIQTRRYVTVAELSRVLRMSRANARHHLAILEQQGLVRVAGERPLERGRGRPQLLYGLAETAQAHNLDTLVGVLLDLLAVDEPAEHRLQRYRTIAAGLKSAGLKSAGLKSAGCGVDRPAAAPGRARPGLKAVQPRSASLTQRLAATVQDLNHLNYQARWEAHAQGPRLILEHCPYAAILKNHPEICQIDRFLLQELTGVPVAQTERLALDERGAPFCRFALQTR